MKKRLLFVCIGNSCRSQISEAMARHLGKDKVEAWSAGSRPAGYVNENAIAVLKEKGIDATGAKSKGLTELPKLEWDYIVTMGCGDACPHLPAKNRLDWELPDPVGQPIEEFRKMRDDIESRMSKLIDSL